MKLINKICLIAGGSALLMSTASAGDDTWYGKNPAPAKAPVPAPLCFEAGETSLDIVSVYADPTGGGGEWYDGSGLDSGVGGGLALTHFYTENLGVSAGAYWWDGNGAIHSVTGSVIYRHPLQDLCLAPYVYGGVGGHFDSVNQISGHLGAGVEYRVTDSVGIFADYRYTWADETEDWNLYTLGLRILF